MNHPRKRCNARCGEETQEGYRVNNVLASYAHLHLASNPALAAAFVDQCESYRATGGSQPAMTDVVRSR